MVSNKVKKNSSDSPRVLLFSQRNIYEPEVWRCAFREFEEIVREIDSVEMIVPSPAKWFKYRRQNAQRIGKYTNIVLNPGIPEVSLNKYYDLFIAVCEKPSELLNVNAVKGWKDYCKTSVCWLTELWVNEMPLFKSSLKILSKFDYVLSHLSQSVQPIINATGTQCSYVPAGIDTILFCPYPKPPARVIDVLSVGRRDETFHQDLLRMALEKNIFYIHDTINNLHAIDLDQHRHLFANMAKRSRYFMVNIGKFDRPEESGSQTEIGYRYFEGAASGAIMIGSRPQNDVFTASFPWHDVVIQTPNNSSGGIKRIIDEVDNQPDRQEQIRRNNVVNSLLSHDWAYRWEKVLSIAGLKPMRKLLQRKNSLQELANLITKENE